MPNCGFFGEGNFYDQAVALSHHYRLEHKVKFKRNVLPHLLKDITPKARLGITLFQKDGLSNYYSLANRFFDYIQAGVPQLCVKYPVYEAINSAYEVAVLIDDLSSTSIAQTINQVLGNQDLLKRLEQNCLQARQVYNWQQEQKKLLSFYQKLFND